MKTGILGGCFSPITLGHIEVAECALKVVDRVVFIPCNKSVFGKDLIDPSHILKMCSLAIKDKRMSVDDYEIKNKLPGDTFSLVDSINKSCYFGNDSLYFIIGMDEANAFHKWVSYQELKHMIQFIVVPRTGQEQDKSVNWYREPPHVFLKPEKPLLEMSSTKIREALQWMWTKDKGHGYESAVILEKGLDRDVLQYIGERKLYCEKRS